MVEKRGVGRGILNWVGASLKSVFSNLLEGEEKKNRGGVPFGLRGRPENETSLSNTRGVTRKGEWGSRGSVKVVPNY